MEVVSFENKETNEITYQVTVPCKVNLFLDVLGRRPDGYHELDTIMLGVSLTDRMRLIPNRNTEWTLNIHFEDDTRLAEDDPAWDVPSDETNLVIRALKLLAGKLGIDNAGASVELHKSIPAMAGLGGGSANAAAALALGYAAWGKAGDWGVVLECASQLGSDINFFLEGQNQDGYWLARCRGRGERIEPMEGKLQDLALVLVHPPAGCETADVFRRLNARTTSKLAIAEDGKTSNETDNCNDSIPSIERLERSLASGDPVAVGKELYNALLIPASEVTNWISCAGSWIDRYDHFGQTLSGSGSTRFCLCSSWKQAEIIERELRSLNMVRAYAVRPWHQSRLQEQMQAIKGLSQ